MMGWVPTIGYVFSYFKKLNKSGDLKLVCWKLLRSISVIGFSKRKYFPLNISPLISYIHGRQCGELLKRVCVYMAEWSGWLNVKFERHHRLNEKEIGKLKYSLHRLHLKMIWYLVGSQCAIEDGLHIICPCRSSKHTNTSSVYSLSFFV